MTDVVLGATIKLSANRFGPLHTSDLHSLLVTKTDRIPASENTSLFKGHLLETAAALQEPEQQRRSCYKTTLKNLILFIAFSGCIAIQVSKATAAAAAAVFRGRKKLLSCGWVLWLEHGGWVAASMGSSPENKRSTQDMVIQNQVSTGHPHWLSRETWNASAVKGTTGSLPMLQESETTCSVPPGESPCNKVWLAAFSMGKSWLEEYNRNRKLRYSIAKRKEPAYSRTTPLVRVVSQRYRISLSQLANTHRSARE